MKMASGAMNQAEYGASGTSPLIGMNYGPQRVDISKLMAILSNRQKLGTA